MPNNQDSTDEPSIQAREVKEYRPSRSLLAFAEFCESLDRNALLDAHQIFAGTAFERDIARKVDKCREERGVQPE